MGVGAVPARGLPDFGWPDYGLLESPPSGRVATATYRRDDEMKLVWFGADPATADRLTIPYVDYSLEGGRYMSGNGSFIVPASADIVTMFRGSTVGQEFAEGSVRAFFRNGSEPIWSGPMVGCRLAATGDAGYVELIVEQFFGHFLKRRMILESALASKDYTAGVVAADNIALQIFLAEIGPGATTPPTYPGGATRTDFGSFTPTGHAVHSPALSASLPKVVEQSGTVVQGWFEEFAEQEDLAAVMSDPLTNAFELDVGYPYEAEDVSADIIFGQAHGNLTAFEATNDLKSLANVWHVEGATVASHKFAAEAGSIAVWGVFEGREQKGQDAANAFDTQTKANYLASRYGPGTITYKATVVETPGCLFNSDWSQRSTVAFDEIIHGFQFSQTCVQWTAHGTDGGPPSWEFVFGKPRLSAMKQLMDYVGMVGPKAGGNTHWRNKRQ